MTNLRDFINQKKSQNETSNKSEKDSNNYEKILKDNPDKIEDIQEGLKKYQNMSQNELMSELMKEANRMKQNGSLNESSLNMLKNTLMPMLNDEQKSMFNTIINQIK